MFVNMLSTIMEHAIYMKKYQNHGFEKKLYRYRQLNHYTLSALSTGELWGSLGTEMEDKDDCSVSIEKITKKYKNAEILKLKNRFTEYYRMAKYLICLTPFNNSSYMWERYADNYKGFVVEYDTEELLRSINNFLIEVYGDTKFSYKNDFIIKDALINNDLGIARVSYTDTPLDMSEHIEYYIKNLNKINNEEPSEATIKNNLLVNEKVVSIKLKSFSDENEIRIILPSKYNFETSSLEITRHKALLKIEPKSIVLGKNMESSSRKVIFDIANKKGIKIIEA